MIMSRSISCSSSQLASEGSDIFFFFSNLPVESSLAAFLNRWQNLYLYFLLTDGVGRVLLAILNDADLITDIKLIASHVDWLCTIMCHACCSTY